MKPLIWLMVTAWLALSPGRVAALVVTQVALPANDLAFNPVDGYLYASVPSTVPLRGNTVTRIDPATGAILSSLTVGSEPGKLAISGDGTTMYVVLNGASAIRRVDLVAFTAGLQFPLPTSPFWGPYGAEDVTVQPGSNDVIAVAMTRPGVSPRHAGVAIFENGVARANVTQDHTGSNRIEFGASAARVYGYNNETTEFGFRRLSVSSTGVQEQDVVRDLISGFGVEILHHRGRVYASNGKVIDPENRASLGTFALSGSGFSSAFAPDSDRVYFVTGESGTLTLTEYDAFQFTPVLGQPVPGVQGGARVMVRWGPDGLAFTRTTQYYGSPEGIVLLRRIHEPPMADLAVRQTDSIDPVDLGQSFNYRVVVRNHGPDPSADVVLRDVRPAGASGAYASPSRGYCYDSSGVTICPLGAISGGDSAVVQLYLQANTLGTLENVARVSSSTHDPDPSNNESIETTTVRTPPSADLFVRVSGDAMATLDRPTSFTVRVGNRGPDPAANASLSLGLGGVPYSLVSIESPRGTCGSGPYGGPGCSLGEIAAGDSFDVVVAAVPLGLGFFSLYAGVSSTVGDPALQDNNAGHGMTVHPSAIVLIEDLVSLLWSYGLRAGTERGLEQDLEDARDAIATEDTLAACGSLDSFRNGVSRRAGRGLTVAQAYALDREAVRIMELIGCGDSDGTPGNGPKKPAAEPVALDAGLPEALTLSRIAGAGPLRVELAMPKPGTARVEALDLLGRRVALLFEGELAAGRHPIGMQALDRGAGPGSGVYFLRAVAAGQEARTKLVIVR